MTDECCSFSWFLSLLFCVMLMRSTTTENETVDVRCSIYQGRCTDKEMCLFISHNKHTILRTVRDLLQDQQTSI